MRIEKYNVCQQSVTLVLGMQRCDSLCENNVAFFVLSSAEKLSHHLWKTIDRQEVRLPNDPMYSNLSLCGNLDLGFDSGHRFLPPAHSGRQLVSWEHTWLLESWDSLWTRYGIDRWSPTASDPRKILAIRMGSYNALNLFKVANSQNTLDTVAMAIL